MTDVAIENPILNSPDSEPKRHFRFDEERHHEHVDVFRRVSTYFVPIVQPRKKACSKPLTPDGPKSA